MDVTARGPARPMWRPVLLCAMAGTTVAVANALLDWPIGTAERRMAIALAVASGLLLGALPRWPLVAVGAEATAVVVTTRFSPFTNAAALLFLLVALGVLAYRARWPVTLAGAVTTYAALVLQASFGSDIDAPLATLLGLTALPVVAGRYLAGLQRARRVAEERAAEAEARRTAETHAARLAERARLARDLHDIIAHHVGAMTLRASVGTLALDSDGDPAVARGALVDVATTGRQALDELRSVLAVLRDPDAVDAGVGSALVTDPEATLVDAVARLRRAGVPVTAEVDPRLADTSLLVRTTVVRVVQEALTNVLKHTGPGTETTVGVTVSGTGSVRAVIENARPSGPGPAPFPASGQGLDGMRQRVAVLHGTLAAGPTSRSGWRVEANLPGKGQP
ncbi:sensor histidine kinase [Micromonospora sp. CPCC 206061]|uniref:sensor histidine kinase n=1 Tax=Micromonospora sp. CPCC 206061 TaxID=3122410 RepID=UPI002FF285FF